MLLIKDLSKGLEILDPFLREYGFEFDKYNFDTNSESNFSLASYKNESKKFIIDYRFSTGQILYQYGNCIVSHPFYLDNLGFTHKKKHNGFLQKQKLEAFNHILHDFEYLLDDFFKGECDKLKEISELQENIITEVDRKIRLENGIRLDNIRIEKARREFRNKEHLKCLDIYKFVDNRDLLVELDFKIMEYCNRHI
ncbi:MAG: hypothetical protein KA133_05905 [Flavobacterium sp.]|nr:hypothetical protein [Flavobacterium sp.]